MRSSLPILALLAFVGVGLFSAWSWWRGPAPRRAELPAVPARRALEAYDYAMEHDFLGRPLGRLNMSKGEFEMLESSVADLEKLVSKGRAQEPDSLTPAKMLEDNAALFRQEVEMATRDLWVVCGIGALGALLALRFRLLGAGVVALGGAFPVLDVFGPSHGHLAWTLGICAAISLLLGPVLSGAGSAARGT